MGGVHVEEALKILDGCAIRYLPFAGKPSGHPTRLGGSAEEVEAQCRAFARTRLGGVDILAYRATEAEPLDLVAACRRGFLNAESSWLPEASIRSNASPPSAPRARTLSRSARRPLSAAYAPGAGSLMAQLRAVLADCGSSAQAP